MRFQTVLAALRSTLTAQAAGAFQVVGAQLQGAADSRLILPLVEVYYAGGTFDSSRSASVGRRDHEARFRVAITIAAGAGADLTILNNPSATAGQIATALLNSKRSADLADAFLDATFSAVFNILALPANRTLGQAEAIMDTVKFGDWSKAAPLPGGEWTVLTGSFDVQIRMSEQPVSVTQTPINGSDTKLYASEDATADPTTVGQDISHIDPKFMTAQLGQKVGT